jgi:hypothetical protein
MACSPSVRPWLDRRQLRRFCGTGLGVSKTRQAELAGGDRHRRGAKKAAALLVNFLRLPDPITTWPSLVSGTPPPIAQNLPAETVLSG